MKEYKRYEVKVAWYKDMYMIEVKDRHFDSHDYAFCNLDGSKFAKCENKTSKNRYFTSYSNVAADYVESRLGALCDELWNLVPGCYAIYTDDVHGEASRIERIK